MYNSSLFVGGMIHSVIAQTYEDWELLIVDDCSSDNSLDTVASFSEDDDRIKLISLEKNSGPAVARNIAIEAARGRFIAFLDSDDIWYPNKLSLQCDILSNQNACFAFSQYHHIDERGEKVLRVIPAPETITYDDILEYSPVGCLTAIYDTQKAGKLFMPDIRMRQDWGLWLRVLRRCRTGVGIQEPLAALRLHPKSLSANKLRATFYNYKLLRTEGKLGPVKAARNVVRHAIGAIRRRAG